jgi:hypothetical protein
MKQKFLNSAAIALAVSLVSGAAMAMESEDDMTSVAQTPSIGAQTSSIGTQANSQTHQGPKVGESAWYNVLANYKDKKSWTRSLVTKGAGGTLITGGLFGALDAINGFSTGSLGLSVAKFFKQYSALSGVGGVIERRSLQQKAQIESSKWYYAAYATEALGGVAAMVYGVQVIRKKALTQPVLHFWGLVKSVSSKCVSALPFGQASAQAIN